MCWRVTDGATMAFSDDDSRCVLDTHPRTLPCLSVGVLRQGIAASVMGTTTASPLERVPRTVVCGAARRFACSPTDRTAQSFHCGHSVGITRCGGVRRSRSPDEDGLVVIWQLGTSSPSPFRIALAARLAQQQPDMVLLQECRHESAQRRGSLAAVTSARRAVGVPVAWPSWCARPCRASACRCWQQLRGDHCLPRAPTGQPQHVRGEPLQPFSGNRSRCSLCEHHLSPWFCSAYCVLPEFTP
ncbi:trans-sialidase [Trypanosoma cruzi]|nr:trans-sialidase [Trypanosoma cruzi]